MTTYYPRPAQTAIIKSLKTHGYLTIKQIAEDTGLTVSSAKAIVQTISKERPHMLTKLRIKDSVDGCRVAYGWNDDK